MQKTLLLLLSVSTASIVACKDDNDHVCPNIGRIRRGSDTREQAIERCEKYTTPMIVRWCRNPQAVLKCAGAAVDKDALEKCDASCDARSCAEAQEAEIARLGNKIDDATREAMRKKNAEDGTCKSFGRYQGL